jgi:predicted nucleotidyltransferase
MAQAARFFMSFSEDSYFNLFPQDIRTLVGEFIEWGVYNDSCYVFNDGAALLAAKRCTGERGCSFIRWDCPKLVAADALPFDWKMLAKHSKECDYYDERVAKHNTLAIKSASVHDMSSRKRFFKDADEAKRKEPAPTPRNRWGMPIYEERYVDTWLRIDTGEPLDDDY